MAQYDLLPLGDLGAVEKAGGVVSFGLWLPWVSPAGGFSVSVKIIHEDDQFLKDVQPREFRLEHRMRDPHGDFWSADVPVGGPPAAGTSWGRPGRHLYRYVIDTPTRGRLDWISDPFAREFGTGKQSAFTLGYAPYQWSAKEADWRTPALHDLVIYEINVVELAGDFARAGRVMAYLADLGVNAIEVMPLSNSGRSVDWGYEPLGYFGVDERLGNRRSFQALVDLAHQHGIAVIVDAVYGHTGADFPYEDVYDRLNFDQNPFMGEFSKGLFGFSTDFNRKITRDYFLSVNNHWLDVYHVDGFRYDCVPNYWDGPEGVGYAGLVYATETLVRAGIAGPSPRWTRFGADPQGRITLVQCAEQLEAAKDVLIQSHSNCTWQNGTFERAKEVAKGNGLGLTGLGFSLGLFGFVEGMDTPTGYMEKTALQYIENHDHERFVCNFGLINSDTSHNELFVAGNRDLWYRVQPYVIALLCAKGIPMLWQGQEFVENYFLPDQGRGRIAMLRPLRWDYFYDPAGRGMVGLVRKLLSIRKNRANIRSGKYFFFNDWNSYLSRGVLLFARWDDHAYTVVAVNTTEEDVTVPFWFAVSGDYVEEIHGGSLDLANVRANERVQLVVPSNYGRIWTREYE